MNGIRTVADWLGIMQGMPPTMLVSLDGWTAVDAAYWILRAIDDDLDAEGLETLLPRLDDERPEHQARYLATLGIDLYDAAFARRALRSAIHGEWLDDDIADIMTANMRQEFAAEIAGIVESRKAGAA